jgi:hypothetical protein
MDKNKPKMKQTVIQLMHPGREPSIESGSPSWVVPSNFEEHKRKFLCTPGTYAVKNPEGSGFIESSEASKLVFWGEWEQPSQATAFLPPHGEGYPKAWHEPTLPTTPLTKAPGTMPSCAVSPCTDGFHPNTDPFVFTPGFFYSRCRIKPENRLSRLQPGDLVVFCSFVNDHMVFDTVFVVKRLLKLEDAQRECDLLQSAVGKTGFSANGDCMLYKGANFENLGDQMFSFFPAKIFQPLDSIPRFCRPRVPARLISNSGFSGGNLQSFKIIKAASAYDIWKALVQATLDQDLVLGLGASL